MAGSEGRAEGMELARRVEIAPNAVGANGGNFRITPRQRPLKTKPMGRSFRGEEIPNNPNNWLEGKRTVEYFNDAERAKIRLTVKDGKLYDAEGELFDTTNASTIWSGPNRAIYVMDEKGNIYASKQERGKIHHSSILAGEPVAGAGEIEVYKGELQYINRGSGHYEPTPEMLQQTVDELRANGLRFGDWVIDPDW
jgi:hypothetical protein